MDGSRLYQYLTSYSALLAMVTSGMHYAWPSPSIPQYTDGSSSFKLTNDEASWIIITQVLAQIPCCFMAATINDVIGRKKCILLTVIPHAVGWILIIFATSPVELFLARICAGFSDGIAFTVIPIYIGEIAEAKIRGFLGAGISTTWILGMLLINILGSFLTITVTATISLVLPLLLFVTFIWMPESPYFLLMKKNEDAARASLQKLKGRSDVEEELTRLRDAVEKQNQQKNNLLELFTKRSNQKSLGIMAIVRNSQQMSGVAAISFYTLTIFNEAGDFIPPVAATILYVTIQFIMTAVCSVVIDKAGRRPLLIASLIGSGVCLLTEGVYFYIKDFTDVDTTTFKFVPVAALIGYVVIFHLGAQPIPLLMQGEVFPTNVKGLASCVSEVYFCVLASVFSKFFQIMRDSFGMYVPFLGFAACCAFNLIFVIVFLPETKGKTLEEIQDFLNKK